MPGCVLIACLRMNGPQRLLRRLDVARNVCCETQQANPVPFQVCSRWPTWTRTEDGPPWRAMCSRLRMQMSTGNASESKGSCGLEQEADPEWARQRRSAFWPLSPLPTDLAIRLLLSWRNDSARGGGGAKEDPPEQVQHWLVDENGTAYLFVRDVSRIKTNCSRPRAAAKRLLAARPTSSGRRLTHSLFDTMRRSSCQSAPATFIAFIQPVATNRNFRVQSILHH